MDYTALAQKYGAVASTSNPQAPQTNQTSQDYTALAKQYGAVQSTPQDQHTIAGNIIRGTLKVPLEAGASIARGIGGLFNKDIRDNGISMNVPYVGNVKDYATTVGEKATNLANLNKSGQITPLRTTAGIFGAAAQPALDLASFVPVSGVASAVTGANVPFKQALITSLKRGGGFAGAYDVANQMGSGEKYNPAQTLGSVALGTGLDFGLSYGIPKAKQLATKSGREEIARNSALKELEKLDSYQTIKKVTAKANERGINVKSAVLDSDVLRGSVDRNGVINTRGEGGAIDQFTSQYITPNEALVSDALRKEGASVNPKIVKKQLLSAVDSSGLEGADLTRAIKKVNSEMTGYMLRKDASGNIPVSVIHDAKVAKYNLINYLTPPEKQAYDKAIASALKKIVEKNTQSVDVKAINQELSKYFSVADYLSKLDGKRVDGGRLGKYFARTVGAIAGAKLGPLGPIVGAEVGGRIQGERMAKTFSGMSAKALEKPQAFANAREYINAPQKQLSAPQAGAPRTQFGTGKTIELPQRLPTDQSVIDANYSKSLGSRNQSQSMMTTKYTNPIPPTLPEKKGIASELVDKIKKNGEAGFANMFSTNNLTTKILKDLEGKTTVSRQYILDATNRGELKQAERDITRNVLDTMKGDTINVKEFADKVKSELLPLKRVSSDMSYKENGVTMRTREAGAKVIPSRYESVSLPSEVRGNVKNYRENIYESPIKTSAGDTHFSGNSKNYFGHTRIEDMADNKTRRVIEVQSDLYQKNRLGEQNKDFFPENLTPELAARYEKIKPGMVKEGIAQNAKIAKLQQYNDPTAHFRMIREEIKKAAQDGKTKLQFPTGETAMKIEGLGQGENRWFDVNYGTRVDTGSMKVGDEITHTNQLETNDVGSHWVITDVLGDGKFKAVPKDKLENMIEDAGIASDSISTSDWISYAENHLKKDLESTVETFDISGKVDTNNPIYKFYEKDVQNYLKKFGGKRVVDDKGVSWIEIPISKEQGKAPVEAFGFTQLGMLPKMAGITALGTALVGGYKKIEQKYGTETYTKQVQPQDQQQIKDKKIIDAIRYNETRGEKNPYSYYRNSGSATLGRALGAYQVTEGELKTYAKIFLGKDVTPDVFLANPTLQDEYMLKKVQYLRDKGFTIAQIFAAHRGGFGNIDNKQKMVEKYLKYVNSALDQLK